jgi:hypothetical protein
MNSRGETPGCTEQKAPPHDREFDRIKKPQNLSKQQGLKFKMLNEKIAAPRPQREDEPKT